MDEHRFWHVASRKRAQQQRCIRRFTLASLVPQLDGVESTVTRSALHYLIATSNTEQQSCQTAFLRAK